MHAHTIEFYELYNVDINILHKLYNYIHFIYLEYTK